MKDLQNLPLVIIVGRQNVGKSTLFNRLLRRQRAITAATPGVTRDLVDEKLQLSTISVRLVDTGGISTVEQDSFTRSVGERALDVTTEAAVILFVTDVTGVTPEDEMLADKLRSMSNRVILVVNKVDHEKRESGVWDFHTLGYQPVIGISAAHGQNIDALLSQIEAKVGVPESVNVVPVVGSDVVRLAVVGKPNTGKSTLLNHLLGEEKAMVSPTPGTTRDPLSGRITFGETQIEVIDTAGIRRRSKVDSDVEYYAVNRAASALSDADVGLLLVDASLGLSEQDKRIAAIAIRRGVAILVALSKWDLISNQSNLLTAMIDRIRFQFPILGFVPIVPFSGFTGFGVKTLIEKVVNLSCQLNKIVPTAALNQCIAKWANEYVPTVRGREVKIKYATQTSSNPVRFLFFLNTSRNVGVSFRRFLENRIRSDLGFAEVPVTVEFRASSSRGR